MHILYTYICRAIARIWLKPRCGLIQFHHVWSWAHTIWYIDLNEVSFCEQKERKKSLHSAHQREHVLAFRLAWMSLYCCWCWCWSLHHYIVIEGHHSDAPSGACPWCPALSLSSVFQIERCQASFNPEDWGHLVKKGEYCGEQLWIDTEYYSLSTFFFV